MVGDEQLAFYIAGPMRGYPEFNFPAFHDAERRLRLVHPRATIFNPARHDEENGFSAKGLNGTMEELAELNFDLREALAADCAFICKRATHIIMLEGWSKSRGATAERALALALGIKVEGAPA